VALTLKALDVSYNNISFIRADDVADLVQLEKLYLVDVPFLIITDQLTQLPVFSDLLLGQFILCCRSTALLKDLGTQPACSFATSLGGWKFDDTTKNQLSTTACGECIFISIILSLDFLNG
jgi:hypothetical protein